MSSTVALVTGALTGIGRPTALALAQGGANVVVSGRHDEPGRKLVEELRAVGGDAEFIRADVRFEADLAGLVDGAIQRFGRIDIAVNNAGLMPEFGPLTEITSEAYTTAFDTNVLGTLLSLKHELRVMQAQGFGSIVNVTSIYGDRGFPNASLYVAAKHAIIGLTRSAALEGASHGVRVNAIGPGPVQTAMFDKVTGGAAEVKAGVVGSLPLGRAGEPVEIADAIVYMTSAKAGFLTGQTLFVDGGYLAG